MTRNVPDFFRGRDLYAGFRPLQETDGPRFRGREELSSQLANFFCNSRGGSSRVVLVHGPSGAGKTSLIQAGMLPILKQDLDRQIDCIRVTPGTPKKFGELFQSTAKLFVDLLISKTPFVAGISNDKLRAQLQMVLENAPVEAADTMAALYRNGAGAGSKCVIFFDQFEAIFPEYGLTGKKSQKVSEKLQQAFELFEQLALTNVFPIIVGVRDGAYQYIKDSLESYLESPVFAEVEADHVDSAEIESIVQSFTFGLAHDSDGALEVQPQLEAEVIAELREAPQLLPFTIFSFQKVADEQAGVGTLSLTHFQNMGGFGFCLATQAQAVFQKVSNDARGTFHTLMAALHPVDPKQPETRLEGNHPSSPCRILKDDPPLIELVSALIDARLFEIYQPKDGKNSARIRPIHPMLFQHWELAAVWLDNDLRLRAGALRFEDKRARWEEGDRSPVLLEHATANLDEAAELVSYHETRPFLKEDLATYLRISLELDSSRSKRGFFKKSSSFR